MPVYACEDFSEYTFNIPGAFLFIGTKKRKDQPILHSPKFDFEDGIIELASKLWMKLIENRFELNK